MPNNRMPKYWLPNNSMPNNRYANEQSNRSSVQIQQIIMIFLMINVIKSFYGDHFQTYSYDTAGWCWFRPICKAWPFFKDIVSKMRNFVSACGHFGTAILRSGICLGVYSLSTYKTGWWKTIVSILGSRWIHNILCTLYERVSEANELSIGCIKCLWIHLEPNIDIIMWKIFAEFKIAKFGTCKVY